MPCCETLVLLSVTTLGGTGSPCTNSTEASTMESVVRSVCFSSLLFDLLLSSIYIDAFDLFCGFRLTQDFGHVKD